MRTVEFIDPIESPRWAEFVAASPSSEVFHHPRWLALLRDQYGYEISACCVCGERGIEAALPIAHVKSRLTGNRLVSLPFSDLCSPALATEAELGALATLGDAIAAHARERGLELTVHAAMPSIPAGFVSERFVTHELQLAADPAEVEAGTSKSVRRGANKARREGLRAEQRTDPGALDTFYGLHLRTRQRLGVPTQPKRFIARFDELFAAGLGCVWLVLDGDDVPAAAGVFLTHKETVVYKYGASDAAALPKRPNNLLMLEAVRWCCEQGYRRLDFGRTDRDNKGLRKFKRSWGAEELPLSYTYLTQREPAPVGVSSFRERAMTATIQRSPALVGRLAGEMLYRHVG